MSRETNFKDGAWVGGYEYSDHAHLMSDIAEKEADVNYYKQKVLAMVCATPLDVTPAGEDPLEHVNLLFEELWDGLKEEMAQLSALYFVENNEEYISDGEN